MRFHVQLNQEIIINIHAWFFWYFFYPTFYITYIDFVAFFVESRLLVLYVYIQYIPIRNPIEFYIPDPSDFINRIKYTIRQLNINFRKFPQYISVKRQQSQCVKVKTPSPQLVALSACSSLMCAFVCHIPMCQPIQNHSRMKLFSFLTFTRSYVRLRLYTYIFF